MRPTPTHLFPAVDSMRIPLEYLANLLSAGDTDVIRDVLRRLAAMLGYMRKQQVPAAERREPPGRRQHVGARARRHVQVARDRQVRGALRHSQAHAELADRLAEQGAGAGCGLDSREDRQLRRRRPRRGILVHADRAAGVAELQTAARAASGEAAAAAPEPAANRRIDPTRMDQPSLLLRYPTATLLADDPEIAAAVAELPGQDARAQLGRFSPPPHDAADRPRTRVRRDVRHPPPLHPRHQLLPVRRHAPTRSSLLRLKRLYAAAGLILESDELPDHLPAMLEFAAFAPSGYGERVLKNIGSGSSFYGWRVRRPAASPGRGRPCLLNAPPAGLAGVRRDPTAGRRGPARRAGRTRAVRPTEVMPTEVRVNALHLLLRVALPYIAITVFIAGHIWRYRTDQYGWTIRSTQLLESRKLKWGSILFRYGALAAIGGHVLGILVPASWTSALGVTEHSYHLLSAAAGTVASEACVVGFVLLAWRRITTTRVRVTQAAWTSVYVLLGLVIGSNGRDHRQKYTWRWLRLPRHRRGLVPKRRVSAPRAVEDGWRTLSSTRFMQPPRGS